MARRDGARGAALLLARIDATAPRAPAEAADLLASALDSVRAVLAPVAEENDAAMAAFQIAEDALASMPESVRVVDGVGCAAPADIDGLPERP